MEMLDQLSDLEIEILPSSHADRINEDLWNNLSCNSLYPNPFYERWNLLPALHNLIENEEIYIVLIRHQNELTGLLPVIVLRQFYKIKYLSAWKHKHCYLTDPLLSQKIDMIKIFNQIGTILDTNWMLMPVHSPDLLDNNYHRIYSRQFNRAAVVNTNSIDSHMNSLKGKAKREVRRTLNKITNHFEIKHIEHVDLAHGLQRFTQLEHSGWKGKDLGSILSNKSVTDYYFEMITVPETRQKLNFQELWANDQLVAMNMRMMTQGFWFDVKTSFNEDFKEYSPGKVLELKNLELLKKASFTYLDSCTNPGNNLINKYWPNRKEFQKSWIFYNSIKSRCWQKITEAAHRIKRAKENISIWKENATRVDRFNFNDDTDT